MPETIESLLLNQRYWEIFAVSRDSSIEEACKIMDKNRIGALLVYCSVSNDPQDLEGIVTERDIIELIAKKGRGSLDNEVKEIMSKNIISVTPQCTKMDALDLMMENQIRHLAVMDSEKLVGVLSMRDLIKQL